MKLITCDNLQIIPDRLYGGATGSKVAVRYNNSIWMLKGRERLRDKDFKNVEISYANDPITEYIGSHIYEIFNIPVHSTLLGAHRGKICILCSDDAYPQTLYEFRQFRNAIFADISQPTSGMSTYISDIMQVIELSDRIPKSDAYDRFWKMFVIDSLIGNTDRNNGNWGFLFENGEFKLYEVYDCGGCLNNKRSDDQMLEDLKQGNVNNLALNYTFNFKDERGKRINPFHYIEKNPNETIIETLNLFTEDKLVSMFNLIDSLVPIISDIRVKWYKEMLSLRFNHLVELRDKLFNKEEYLKEYLNILPPAAVADCVTKEDCDALLSSVGLPLPRE